MQLAIAACVIYRICYHSAYIRDVPFALATFSDGRAYEAAALDILSAPPWGTQPLYLQGIYAYFMALPMAVRPWPSLALLAQLAVASFTLWLFFRTTAHWLGRRDAGWALLVLLTYPMLAFYENKYLTASLAVTSFVLLLAAFSWVQRRPHGGSGASSVLGWGMVGAAAGLAVLARPNMVLAIPFGVVAMVLELRRRGVTRWAAVLRRGLVPAVLGGALALAPLAVRNVVVTGVPTVLPAHGGGTSFYIGNNARAKGVWNNASGLLSGDVTKETRELSKALGIDADSESEAIAKIGDALYSRAFDEIREDPGRWLWLELRKAWLMVGNDELTQDYDYWGEREAIRFAHRVGVPFGALMVFGLLGAASFARRSRSRRDRQMLPVAWLCAGLAFGVVAANLMFFTSAQHRLPLVVPLALFGVLGVRRCVELVRERRPIVLVLVAVGLVLVSIPRTTDEEPTAAHYYNLGVAWLRLDQPHDALAAFDRAVEVRPDHPVIRLERATLLRKAGDFERALADIERVEAASGLPGWVRARVDYERRFLPPKRPDSGRF